MYLRHKPMNLIAIGERQQTNGTLTYIRCIPLYLIK